MLTTDGVLARAIPMRTGIGVYFLIREGVIVYVGKSVNVMARIAAHYADKAFDSYTWVRCSRAKMAQLELDYIDLFMPEYNFQAKNYHSKLAVRASIEAMRHNEALSAEEKEQRRRDNAIRITKRKAFLAQSPEEMKRQLNERMAYLRAMQTHRDWPPPFGLSANEIRAKLATV